MDLALFDFDGTITTRELFPDFVRASVSPWRLAVGRLLLAPLVLGYKLGWVPGTVVRAVVVRVGYSGAPLAELERAGTCFAERIVPSALRENAMRRIQWHKDRGDRVVVVSGAFDVYLQPWCEAHGLELICSSLEHSGGTLSGRYDGPQCVLAEKARLVSARYRLGDYQRIYAYGDTREDRHLLGLAHERYYRWELVLAPAAGANS